MRGIASLVLVRRLALLGSLFSIELVGITLRLDSANLVGRVGLAGWIRSAGPLTLASLVVFAGLFLTFALLGYSSELVAISHRMVAIPISRGLAVWHIAALGLFSLVSFFLYGNSPPPQSDLLAFVWLSSGLAAIGFAATALVPTKFWRQLVRGTGYLWVVALVAAVSTGFGGNAMRLLWPLATKITFSLVEVILRPFGNFAGDPATMSIGSKRFTVEISPSCSGLEGIGLILAFTIVWLVLFRRECRFPQALILLPVGVTILFLLNSARIAALILIGNAGFDGIALGGFHSQAGWIAFNFVALGICATAREVSWISKRRPVSAERRAQPATNPTASWLVPLIAILAGGIASGAISSGFEWLYPLRFLTAATALWIFRRQYRTLDWRMDWTAPVAGLLVFAIWIALDRSPASPMPGQLATAPTTLRFGWLAFRLMAAVITVPVAEELAFRGYLLRRFISADWEAVSFNRFSWLAVLASSLIFGLLHGRRWAAGTVAGIVFALCVQRQGRLGNAVVAHATANALLAVDVLVFHRWDLW